VSIEPPRWLVLQSNKTVQNRVARGQVHRCFMGVFGCNLIPFVGFHMSGLVSGAVTCLSRSRKPGLLISGLTVNSYFYIALRQLNRIRISKKKKKNIVAVSTSFCTTIYSFKIRVDPNLMASLYIMSSVLRSRLTVEL
jgi:hypothetical protein